MTAADGITEHEPARPDQIPPAPPPADDTPTADMETPEGQIAWPTGAAAHEATDEGDDSPPLVAWPTTQDTPEEAGPVAEAGEIIAWPSPPNAAETFDGPVVPSVGGSAAEDTTASVAGSEPQSDADTPASHAGAENTQPEGGGDQPVESRYERAELKPTGRTDPLFGEELFIGPDGKEHFVGDAHGTRRNIQGRLIRPDGTFITDAQPRPTAELQERAHQELPTRRDHDPHPGESTVDDAVVDAQKERETIEKARDSAWDKIEPIVDKLNQQGVTIEKSNSRNDNQSVLDQAAGHLSAAERLKLRTELPKVAALNQDLKNSSERLGTAGGALAVKREYPNAVLVSGGDSARGTPGNLDRIVMIDETKKAIIVLEEKGVGSGLGSRITPDTANPAGKNIRAEQGSTSYLRHLLQTDNKLAAVLDGNPQLRQRMQAIINGGGDIKYVVARTAKTGRVTMTDFKIDMARFLRATIKLPTLRRGA